ncbi:hypothetical protein [Deinococcus arenicola]|uniref:ATP-binding protein n=1 Tax=Deinococcus arenicola TaxID=2994950 RepID=A0ABU4DNZ9_9DEIO|nr:hypothetical protein [Deinococcus sp. ZS9-10]MDV6374157.1 hypothetical protein [Deinococcus sp. ZS9-10]
MTQLSEVVNLNTNFARSTRLDADYNQGVDQSNFVLQASTAKSLIQMAQTQIHDHQGAFTWTGPYGSGKSSAALLLAKFVGGSGEQRQEAHAILGELVADALAAAFQIDSINWRVVPVTGRRTDLHHLLLPALSVALDWSDAIILSIEIGKITLSQAVMESLDRQGEGLLLFLDELGKLLEHAALSDADIHLLQDLAELSTRSQGRFVLIGILHQSFDQYASRLGGTPRKEWAKVQGRYHDLSFLTRVDETVSLVSKVIKSSSQYHLRGLSERVADAVARRRPIDKDGLIEILKGTWPLNPVTALLLGPVARQRFAQNERSVFGFLLSAEPHGFVEFLRQTSIDAQQLYSPAHLWAYLNTNFGITLTAGRDGHRYSLAVEAIDRTAAKGSADHVSVAKSAAVIEIFGQGTGLQVNDAILGAACPHLSSEELSKIIDDLIEWAVFVRQPRLSGYAIFAGSDFDLQAALSETSQPLTTAEAAAMPKRVGTAFVTAKRHYFRTGVLRAFDIIPFPIQEQSTPEEVINFLKELPAQVSGYLILILPENTMEIDQIKRWQQNFAPVLRESSIKFAIGYSELAEILRAGIIELSALEKIILSYPQLQGDRIARREISSRRSVIASELQRDLALALNQADWLLPYHEHPIRTSVVEIASQLADIVFDRTPIIQSELIQRDRLSSSAAAAQRELMYSMVQNAHKKDLGLTGYPAEMGLYLTILKATGLHRELRPGQFGFSSPVGNSGGETLVTAWKEFGRAKLIRLADIFTRWSEPPYGMKKGLMPILGLAYILQERERVAIYIDGHYEVELDEIFVDRYLQNPENVQLRKISRKSKDATFVSELATRMNLPNDSTPLVIAQHLFKHFFSLPEYTKRTDQLSEKTIQVRDMVLQAEDPEVLFFDTMKIFGSDQRAEVIAEAIRESASAYVSMLNGLRQEMAVGLGVDEQTFKGITQRSHSVQGVGGDLRFDNFAMRLTAFERGVADMGSMAGMLLGKPSTQWTERDVDQASVALAKLGRQFRENETLTFVKNRPPAAQALALAVGVRASEPTRFARLELSPDEDRQARALAQEFFVELLERASDERIRFGTLAHIVELLIPEAQEEMV